MASNYGEEDYLINQVNLLYFDNEAISSDTPFDLNIKSSHYWSLVNSSDFDDAKLEKQIDNLPRSDKLDFFQFGIKCLARFIQVNFTGPPLDDETVTFLANTVSISDKDCREMLAVNNEEVSVNCAYSYLLLAAKSIFNVCNVSLMLNTWWQIRALFIHQKVLEDLSPSLLVSIETLQKQVKDVKISNIYLHTLFLVEQGHIFCEYRCVAKADDYIKEAYNLIGLKYKLFGKLGKRTKFQDNNIAQLTLEVTFVENPELNRIPVIDGIEVPTNVVLQDDVRLDTVEFESTDGEKKTVQTFPDVEQKTLLLVALHMLISKPLDDLFYEQLKPFIDIIVAQKNTWCVRAATLLLRCKLESSHKRTIERSLMQAEEIVKSMDRNEPNVLNRVGGVFNTSLGPTWSTKQRHADLMLNLGMVKSALAIYLDLQLWEEVIVCYTILEMRNKAEEIIRQQIEIKPTVKLFCLLGDATDDQTWYEHAWELSKKRSYRAQRHWGNFFYERKHYEECIPHFEKSLSINPLQATVWLRLGYAALVTEQWQIAATAYRRFITIEPNGFDAWNNLAKAYIKLGNHQNAYYALQDALRCSFDNWKVWENFLVVTASVKRWNDFIRAYHKLIDLRGKYLDVHLLETLAANLTQIHNEDESNDMKKRTKELLGRLTSLYPAEGAVWEIYAYLSNEPFLEVQRLQKAYRGYVQSNNTWFKEEDLSVRVLRVCQRMAEVVLSDDNFDVMTINSIRLNISSAISAIKSSQDVKEVVDYLRKLVALYAKLNDKCKNLQDAAAAPQDKQE